MKRVMSAGFIFFLISIGIIFAVNAQFEEENFVSGEIIVKYADGIVGNGNEIIDEKNQQIIVYEYVPAPDSMTKLSTEEEIYALRFSNENAQEAVDYYRTMKEVDYVEVNYKMDFFKVPADTNYASQWGLKNSASEESWNLTIGNSSVVIAIIDTGVDWNHPDLSANIWNNSDEDCTNGVDGDGNGYIDDCRGYDFVNVSAGCSDADCESEDNDPMDYQGHGTHVSGIAAGVSSNSVGISGVCWNCSIMPIRAGYKDTSGNGVLTVADAVQALHYAVDNNATIISMSFGGSHSAALEDAINYSADRGVIMVAASGNSGANSRIYPCGYDSVLCVAAFDEGNTSASYSNYGSWVSVSAPGSSILSTYFDDDYTTLSGTSMSTPFVAGAIGLIKTYLPSKNHTSIKSVFNATGNSINFNGIFIRQLDIYASLLSLDSIVPSVNLVSPSSGAVNLTRNQTFICNATDWQLKNVTLFVWNATSLFYNTSTNITGIANQTSFNATLAYGTYHWNCLTYDQQHNGAYALGNFSLFVTNISASLISPLNDTHKNSTQAFNCSSETQTSKPLTNISFLLYNATQLVYNTTQNISGNFNASLFNYTFSQEGNYLWNCKAFNNASELDLADSNFSFNYDATAPTVNLVAPANSSSYSATSQSVSFEFNVIDASTILNCSLFIDGIINQSNGTVAVNVSTDFSATFGAGNYNWSVLCIDRAFNSVISLSRAFSIVAPVADSGSSSGGSSSSGGGGSSGGSGSSLITIGLSKTYVVSDSQVFGGYTQKLAAKDKVSFSFFDDKNNQHSLVMNEIGNDYINATIYSTPMNISLGVGQSALLNLTSDLYYDLFLKLHSIVDKKADVTIQRIHQPIIIGVGEKNAEETPLETFDKAIVDKLEQNITELKIILMALVLIIIGIILFFLLRKNKPLRVKKFKSRRNSAR
ncbi:MAG: S8 family peptidase [Nanoarchaeota archaeon]